MKLKRLILFTALISLNTIFSQNNSVSGKITNSSNALAYVNVYLKNSKIGTASNENGYYKLKDIPKGNYTLVASSVGYQSKFIKITIDENQKITQNLSLSEDDSLDEIVISGTMKPVKKLDSPVLRRSIFSYLFYEKPITFYF
ncbi:carboxypeptidase-like regulatory domain-containing protein [Polaribacter sejongensis]|uniref:carboxypeptidase-like regulatory domain-containing protein n=1 Tax=Polaribacter sejongensis TaxID=985043 RepID=UPI0035A68500